MPPHVSLMILRMGEIGELLEAASRSVWHCGQQAEQLMLTLRRTGEEWLFVIVPVPSAPCHANWGVGVVNGHTLVIVNGVGTLSLPTVAES